MDVRDLQENDYKSSSCTAGSPWQRHIAFSSNYVLNLEENSNLHLQAELFLPDWVQVAVDCLCSLLGFTHLDGHIRITGTCPVLGLETLRTDDWHTHTHRKWLWKLHKNNKHLLPTIIFLFLIHIHIETHNITHTVMQSLVTQYSWLTGRCWVTFFTKYLK